MTTLKFRCKLLSEVIVSQKAATEGSHETLSFIPGNVFLGIVASGYGSFSHEDQVSLFHSGKVRFGDAHPVGANDMKRSLHIPAAFYYPKSSGLSSGCFLYHFYDRNAEATRPLQLKQCRQGFYVFDGTSMKEIRQAKEFAIKSAYNRDLRRSDDSRMYGYEALEKGMVFLFSVECDDPHLAGRITEALTGIKHIGRSRTAQYGLAEIQPFDYEETQSAPATYEEGGDTYITVYADGRLIFLDETGMPTCQPTARDLGLTGEIVWEKSQVRTFQYAPWNGKRQTRDTDRVGLEKGTVLVVRLAPGYRPDCLPTYVGCYQNEGFGKVIYGWSILQQSGANGRLGAVVSHAGNDRNAGNAGDCRAKTPLLSYLKRRKGEKEADAYVYAQVNEFVQCYGKRFSSASFASQWGAIRNIAIQHRTRAEIVEELFDKMETVRRVPTPTDPRKEITSPAAYLTHGIAAEKWKGERLKVLKGFVDEMGNSKYGDLSQKALVNLSSEMAKKC